MRVAPFECPDDPELHHFVEEEFFDIGVYRQAKFVKSAWQVFQAARQRFGDRRCIGLGYLEH